MMRNLILFALLVFLASETSAQRRTAPLLQSDLEQSLVESSEPSNTLTINQGLSWSSSNGCTRNVFWSNPTAEIIDQASISCTTFNGCDIPDLSGGNFTAHYIASSSSDPNKLNPVPMGSSDQAFIDNVLCDLEEARNFFVCSQPYFIPPAPDTQETTTTFGSPEYDVYFTDLTTGTNGVTIPCCPLNDEYPSGVPAPWNAMLVNGNPLSYPNTTDARSTYIKLDNTLSSLDQYYDTGTHEYFHMIQYGYSKEILENPLMFSEGTAEWSVHHRFGQNYDFDLLLNSFLNPHKSFFRNSGTYPYSAVYFWVYLTDQYGDSVIREMFELVAAGNDNMTALEQVLASRNITFERAYENFLVAKYLLTNNAPVFGNPDNMGNYQYMRNCHPYKKYTFISGAALSDELNNTFGQPQVLVFGDSFSTPVQMNSTFDCSCNLNGSPTEYSCDLSRYGANYHRLNIPNTSGTINITVTPKLLFNTPDFCSDMHELSISSLTEDDLNVMLIKEGDCDEGKLIHIDRAKLTTGNFASVNLTGACVENYSKFTLVVHRKNNTEASKTDWVLNYDIDVTTGTAPCPINVWHPCDAIANACPILDGPDEKSGSIAELQWDPNKSYDIEVYSITGQLVDARAINNEQELSLLSYTYNHLQNGIYVCLLKENNMPKTTSKFVVQH